MSIQPNHEIFVEGMFCSSCHYPLVKSDQNRCPECGSITNLNTLEGVYSYKSHRQRISKAKLHISTLLIAHLAIPIVGGHTVIPQALLDVSAILELCRKPKVDGFLILCVFIGLKYSCFVIALQRFAANRIWRWIKIVYSSIAVQVIYEMVASKEGGIILFCEIIVMIIGFFYSRRTFRDGS